MGKKGILIMIISIRALKPGTKIIEDVITPLGGVLFKKGKVFTERDLMILDAFMIKELNIEEKKVTPSIQKLETIIEKHNPLEKSVTVEKPSAIKEEAKQSTAIAKPTSFKTSYDVAFTTLKKTYKMIKSGAPFTVFELRNALESLVPHIQTSNLFSYRNQNHYDEYLYHHSLYVGIFSYFIAKSIQFQPKELIQILMAGTLHDIGMIKVDDKLLDKQGPLSPAEFEEIKTHTVAGYNLLKNTVGINEGVNLAALQHHEREDGSGYPLGFTGDKLHRYAKVVAIADIFHAMSSNKSYRRAVSPYLVMEQILKDSFGKLDPTMVHSFVSQLTQFGVGTKVLLSNNEKGEIIFIDASEPTRPWVKVRDKIVNLSIERSIVIEEIIQG
jgi:HD-GYP domain-containing protein (c-di-GMP phosphodiesterase class II)